MAATGWVVVFTALVLVALVLVVVVATSAGA